MADEIRIDVNDIKYVSPGYMIELREQIADLKHQLAEANQKLEERDRAVRTSDGEYNARIDTLSMFVRRLYRRFRKHEPDADVITQANTYLKAIGKAGTPLRAEEASHEFGLEGR